MNFTLVRDLIEIMDLCLLCVSIETSLENLKSVVEDPSYREEEKLGGLYPIKIFLLPSCDTTNKLRERSKLREDSMPFALSFCLKGQTTLLLELWTLATPPN